ncbi:MAG: hypothetical protein J6S58_09790 [Lentisphaeria bacterium]|nr:hypothetical protein [Lentisphaeria bacterium]
MSHNTQFFNDKLSKLRQEIQDLAAKKEYFRQQIDPETINPCYERHEKDHWGHDPLWKITGSHQRTE